MAIVTIGSGEQIGETDTDDTNTVETDTGKTNTGETNTAEAAATGLLRWEELHLAESRLENKYRGPETPRASP